MQLTKNFHLLEFGCKDGVGVPAKYLDNVKKLANNLQVLRDELNSPIVINSAYRHTAYNKRINGVKNSQHLTASASDINVKGFTPEEVAETILELIKEGKISEGGVGLYNSFVHLDIRGTSARWNKSSKYKL